MQFRSAADKNSRLTSFNRRAVVGCALLCLSAASAVSAAEGAPDAKSVIQMLEEKHGRLSNLRFEYEVTSNMPDYSVRGTAGENDRTLRHTTEELALLESKDPQQTIPWLSWIVYGEVKGRTVVSSFFIYDGKTQRRFLSSHGNKWVPVSQSSGLVDTGYTKAFLLDNYFERILFLKLNGSSQNLEAHKKSKSATEYQFVRQEEYLGHKGWLFEREWVPGKLKKTSIVLGDPVRMVVSHETVSTPDNEVLAEFEIDELAIVDGVYYPSKGHYFETESQRKYSFQVTSVTKLDERNRTTWVPNWPGDTLVSDLINGNNYVTAPTAEELAAEQESDTATEPLSRWAHPIGIAVIAIGIALLLALIIAVLLFARRTARPRADDQG